MILPSSNFQRLTKDLEPGVPRDVEGYIMPVPIIPAAVEGDGDIPSVVVDSHGFDLVVGCGERVGFTVLVDVP